MEHLPEGDFEELFGFGLPDQEGRVLAGRIYLLLEQAVRTLGFELGRDPTRSIATKAGYKQVMIFVVDPMLLGHVDVFEKIAKENTPVGYLYWIVSGEATLRKGSGTCD